MDMWVIKETCVDLEYERGFVEIQDGWTVVDIGAAFGDFCNSVATRCPNSSIVAFEPLPGSYQQLCENLASNDVQNVVALNCAVGEKTGRIRIQLPEGVYPGDFCLKDNQADDVEGAHEVECLALSDIFNKYFDRCDFLKIDCEGAEYDILLNAPKEIFSKIRYIAMEYHDFQGTPGHEALVEELKGHGFEVELRPSPVHAYLGLLLAKNTNY
jgi:FkbM family methyltransferase